jgi:hypothetical protein
MQKIPDNFFFGAVTAILSLAITSFLFYSIGFVGPDNFHTSVFVEPKPQLISVLINIILFRFMMVSFKKENTGRGILFTTVVLTFIYFFLYSRYQFRLMPTNTPIEIQNENVNA